MVLPAIVILLVRTCFENGSSGYEKGREGRRSFLKKRTKKRLRAVAELAPARC
jgi:hypothetical protein